jgi:hypothetical protein
MQKADLIAVLGELESGAILIHASDVLTDIVRQLASEGGKGSLTLVLSIKAGKESSPGVRRMNISCEVTPKTPKAAAEAHPFYSVPGGGLTVKHPTQMEFFEDEPKVTPERSK